MHRERAMLWVAELQGRFLCAGRYLLAWLRARPRLLRWGLPGVLRLGHLHLPGEQLRLLQLRRRRLPVHAYGCMLA
jgi:hypothetical protein